MPAANKCGRTSGATGGRSDWPVPAHEQHDAGRRTCPSPDAALDARTPPGALDSRFYEPVAGQSESAVAPQTSPCTPTYVARGDVVVPYATAPPSPPVLPTRRLGQSLPAVSRDCVDCSVSVSSGRLLAILLADWAHVPTPLVAQSSRGAAFTHPHVAPSYRGGTGLSPPASTPPRGGGSRHEAPTHVHTGQGRHADMDLTPYVIPALGRWAEHWSGDHAEYLRHGRTSARTVVTLARTPVCSLSAPAVPSAVGGSTPAPPPPTGAQPHGTSTIPHPT
jgi:hypothetical protein